MRTLFWFLTLAALAIGVALLGRLTDGYVLWVLPPWRVELSFNLFVLLQLAALLVVYLLLRLIVNTLRLPGVVATYRARRARARRERTASEMLRLFWEGRYSQVLKLADKFSREKIGAGETAAERGEAVTLGIVALVALKAAHALRDPGRIARWQAQAQALDAVGWRTARLMAELSIALDGRDFSAAHQALERLTAKERRQISVQRLALRLAQEEGNWAEVLRITRLLEKHHALNTEQARSLRLAAQRRLIEACADDPALLMRHWRSMTAEERCDAQLALKASRLLAAAGACAECAELVEEFLDETWEPALIKDYAACPGGDVLGRIAHCEKWLAAHPQDAELLLALGRLCFRHELWGKAQSYLEAALAVTPSCEAHLELARLFDRLERVDEANRHYRAAADCQEAASQSRGGRNSV
ncbi:MAG: heme biosynthesis HemY N-terminal domain-containing protein [Pseudomonadota bacterium]|nr:heme biosynthesis HemY N-terminal domain-containing protein [Rhodocyclaceae bacterium]